MAAFSMRQHGPSSINPPTLDLTAIGPKVKRPRPKFVSPGQHWDYDQVDSDEYDYEEPGWGLADIDETMDRLTPEQQSRVLAKVDQLEDATDAAISGLIDEEYSNTIRDAIAEELYPPAQPAEQPAERVYSAVLDTLLRQQAKGYAVTQQELQTLWRLAPQVQR
jgi:hypothetical protein